MTRSFANISFNSCIDISSLEPGASSDSCDETYNGPWAFSAVEVNNVALFLNNISNLKSYWNIHSYGQLVLTPGSYTSVFPDDYGEIVSKSSLDL